MFRICTIAALIALTTSAAQADSLAQRIHDAAEQACAVETVPHMNAQSHYRAIKDECVHRLSREATVKYEALAKSGTQTAEASKFTHN
jgi:LmbE family N-acetylglucosaminyl deacetylase